MSIPRICLVTIHGIGFEQPPIYDTTEAIDPVIPGYADALHEYLSSYLGTLLSDDPKRARTAPGQNGPIYVQSVWPGNSYNLEAGRSRLGSWRTSPTISIDSTDKPLFDQHGSISHVALVYSQEEEHRDQPLNAVLAGLMGTVDLKNYGSLFNVGKWLFSGLEPIIEQGLHPHTQPTPTSGTGLHMRQDPGYKRAGHTQTTVAPKHPDMSLLGLLENDVAAYVFQDRLRHRIRGFVRDALLRLSLRDDVDGIVLNAHSNGTVIAYDVLPELPPFASQKILGLITAGSPLRKYTKLFEWGRDLAMLPPLKTWINFIDPKDIVADPLYTPADWLLGEKDPIVEARHQGTDSATGNLLLNVPPETEFLYRSLDPDTGEFTNIPIQDRIVNNLANSVDGGLKAHNYWNNQSEFVQPLATILQDLLG